MFKKIWRWIFGDPYAFRRIDFPGFSDSEIPKNFIDVDRLSPELRAKRRRNKTVKFKQKHQTS